MRIVRCDKGHFYDGAENLTCPICKDLLESRFIESEDTWSSTPTKNDSISPLAIESLGSGISMQLPSPWNNCIIKEVLGKGATGSVYRLQQVVEYAVKLIPWLSENSRDLAFREYNIARKFINCEHTIHYLDYCETDSSSIIIQELSTPWTNYAKINACTIGEILNAIIQVCDALSAMHSEGFLHMDVNPKNVFISNGVAKLGDFSHAQPFSKGKIHARHIGTYQFMAPEIINNKPYSGKEDIYSLGITMFSFLTGGGFPFDFTDRTPKTRKESDQIITMGIDNDLMSIIEKAVAFSPKDRYENVKALADDVSLYISSHPCILGKKVISQEAICHTGISYTRNILAPKRASMDEDYYTCALSSSISSKLSEMDYTSTLIFPDVQSLSNNNTFCSVSKETTKGDIKKAESSSDLIPCMDEVQFAAVTESNTKAGNYGIVNIAVFTAKNKGKALDLIKKPFKHSVEETYSHEYGVMKDSEITIRLSAKGADIEEDTITYQWNGEYMVYSFDYHVSEEQKQILFRAKIYIGGVAVTTLRFTVDVDERKTEMPDVLREDINSAFLSYAREDMWAVTYILQTLKKARPNMDIFFDLEKLRSGEHWEERLYSELAKRDCLYLCWSRHAAMSEWVNKEWRCMKDIKGVEAIEPFPLEKPNKECPIPEELRDLHFNDIEALIREAYSVEKT